MGKGGVHLGPIYFYSQVGVEAKCNLDLLETVAFTLCSPTGPWIVGGDWNCTLSQLLATDWFQKVGGVITAPTAATCFGKVFDFFVVAAPSRMTSSAPIASVMPACSRNRHTASSLRASPEP